ncbi:MAG: CDP-alcohol phosphatidyltransferase family protein [Candidatus Poribacteria bacterium]|nr:CDP-alcohol phosphatidyltransferase family protein [Candidatus Poribacteria bacterium]
MIANAVTFLRLFLTVVVVALFNVNYYLDIGLIVTIAGIFILDVVGGIIARKCNQTTKLGTILDTVVNRSVENTFWIYFTVTGLIPLWMPITVLARGFFTDNLQQCIQLSTTGWAHILTRSRTIHALYDIAKMSTFLCLAGISAFKPENPVIELTSIILATGTIGFCILRGIPLFIETCKIFTVNPQ